MPPDPFEIEFRAVVDATPTELRQRLVESVVGDGSGGVGDLEILDNGPDRFASRFRAGQVHQLRVAEWSSPNEAQGAVEHSIGGRVRISARYSVRIRSENGRTVVGATYILTTPFQGLAFSFRLGRRWSLVRRLASSWLPIASAPEWKGIEIIRSGAVRSAGSTPGARG
jgi:hypothetical protein